MEKKFVMTAIGADRPGFVADVTQLIYEQGCNLEDSTMARLEDDFAMIFSFSGQGDDVEEQLSKACRRLEREKGISAFLRPIIPVHQNTPKPRYVSHVLVVEGIDHVGIVYRVSRYLADYQITIAKLHSKVSHSPGSGTLMFHIEMQIDIPEETALDELRAGLAQLGDELHVDIAI